MISCTLAQQGLWKPVRCGGSDSDTVAQVKVVAHLPPV